MDIQPAFGRDEMLTHIVTDMAQAVSERNGETRQQQLTRCQAAVAMILSFRPRDAIEAMLAGHCVMFHEVIVDSVRDTLRGELDTMRRATRSGIVAMTRSFAGNLGLLERYQMRPSEAASDDAKVAAEAGATTSAAAPVAESVAAEPAIHASTSIAAAAPAGVSVSAGAGARASATPATLARTPASGVSVSAGMGVRASATPALVVRAPASGASASVVPTPARGASALAADGAASGSAASRSGGSPPVSSDTRSVLAETEVRTAEPVPAGAAASGGPSTETLAAFHANPEAAAALEAGDAAGFARAMGIEPSAEFLAAAAAPGSPFDRKASGPWVIRPAAERNR